MNRIFHRYLIESRMAELLEQRDSNGTPEETQLKKIQIDTWCKMMDDQLISKQDMNNLVMNFFVVEGFKEAAENFKREANINIDETELMDFQDKVRGFIFEDRIEDVIDSMISLDEHFFDNNKELFYELNIQQLLSLIQHEEFQMAIIFAKEKIHPLIGENVNYKDLLEKAMCLMAFKDQDKFPYSELQGNQRQIKISSMMNHALLRHKSVTTEPKLSKLVKLMKWMQCKLSDKVIFPMMNDVSQGNLSMVDTD